MTQFTPEEQATRSHPLDARAVARSPEGPPLAGQSGPEEAPRSVVPAPTGSTEWLPLLTWSALGAVMTLIVLILLWNVRNEPGSHSQAPTLTPLGTDSSGHGD